MLFRSIYTFFFCSILFVFVCVCVCVCVCVSVCVSVYLSVFVSLLKCVCVRHEAPSETSVIDAFSLQVAVTPDRGRGTFPNRLLSLAGPTAPGPRPAAPGMFSEEGGEKNTNSGAKYLRREVKSIIRACKISLLARFMGVQ